jgi:hypothetical protein
MMLVSILLLLLLRKDGWMDGNWKRRRRRINKLGSRKEKKIQNAGEKTVTKKRWSGKRGGKANSNERRRD